MTWTETIYRNRRPGYLDRRLTAQMPAPPQPRRYATLEIKPLNGGHGILWRNFTCDQFEFWYRRTFPWFAEHCGVPDRGAGAIGDGTLNYAWKIYGEGE